MGPHRTVTFGPRSENQRLIGQRKVPICRHFQKTGATGLEPATSGVTARFRAHNTRGQAALNITADRRIGQADVHQRGGTCSFALFPQRLGHGLFGPRSGLRRLSGQHKVPICRHFNRTGATGLEPATSGVTGRIRHRDTWRRTPSNNVICRYFSPRRRLRSAWLSQSSTRRLGHEWPTSPKTTAGLEEARRRHPIKRAEPTPRHPASA